MRISTSIKVCVILGMALFLTLPLAAQTTYTWSGLDTTWSTASAWSPNGVPGASDTAVVNGGIVTLDSNVDLGGLNLQGGIITGGSTMNISGAHNWIGGRWQGSGTTNLAAGAQLVIDDINLKIIDGWHIVNNGAATWSNTGEIRIQGGGSLTNGASGVFTIQNSVAFDISTGGGTVTNNGIMTKTSTGTTTIEMTFNNNGTVNLNNGSLQILSGGSNSDGIYNLANGALLGFQSSAHTFNNVAFNGTGSVDFTNGIVATVGGVNGLSVAGGITLNMTGNNTAINGTGPVTINGTLNFGRNEIAGSGAFTINGNMIISGTSSRNINGRILTNNGSITWSGSGTLRLLNNAQIINQAGASFITSIDGVLDYLDPSGGTFTNHGTFTKSAGGGNSVIDVAFQNNGTVNVNSGTLRLTRGGGGTAGTYNMVAASKLEFDGGTHVLDNPVFSTAGTVQISSNTVTLNGGGINLGATNVFNMNGGTMNGTAPLTSSGIINWNGGNLAGSGALTSNNLMNIAGGAGKTLNGRTFNNNGTVNWSGTGTVNLDNNAQFVNQNSGVMNLNDVVEMDFVFPGGGTLVNHGTINRNIGAGESVIDVPVTNNGTLNLNTGNMVFQRGSSSGGGTYALAAGSILEFDGGTHTLDNTVINGGGMLIARDAVMNLSGANGLTIESGATLETIGTASQIEGPGPLTVNGTLKWNRGDIAGSAPFTVNGTLDINGTSTRDLDGRTITNNGLMKWTNDGILRLLNNAQVLNTAGGTIDLQADGNIDFFTPNGGTVVNNGAFKKTAGTTVSVIDVAFTNNGAFDVNAGHLRMTRGGSFNNATIGLAGGALLEFDGGTHVLDNTIFNGNGSVKLTSNFLTVNGSGATFNPGVTLEMGGGTLQGSGAVTINGPMTWNRSIISGSGAFNVNGPLTVQGNDTRILSGRILTNTAASTWSGTGETRLSNSAQLINEVSGSIDLQSDANFTVSTAGSGTIINKGTLLKSVNNLGSTNVGMNLSNTGTINIATGTLRMLAALNNNAVGTIKGAGVLNISSGSLINNGKVEPGTSPGTLTIIGNYAPSASAALNIELGGSTPGTQYDQLLVTGNATLNGALNVSLVNGFTPSPGETFEVLNFASRSGQFSAINTTAPGIEIIPTYNNTSLLLTAQLANVAPVAVDDDATTDEDVALGVNVLANDYDLNGDAMTITGFTQPAHGAVSQSGDSVLVYTPAADYFGVDAFTYIIAEGTGLSDTATVNLTVNAVNDPPVVAGIPNVSFPEDNSTTLDLDPFASDIDNDISTLNWSAAVIAAQPLNQPGLAPAGKAGIDGIEVDPSDLQVSINPATHVATFTSSLDSTGIFTVVFTAADPGGLSDSDTMLVTVTSGNDQPYVANPISDRTYAEDSGPHTVVTNLDSVFADPDPGTVFSYSAASGNSNVQVSVQNKALIVNFTANAFGSFQITVTANDGSGGSVDDQFNLTITPVNDPPVVAGIPNVNFPEDSSATLDLDPYVSDLDNDISTLNWSAAVIAAQPLNQPGLAPAGKAGRTEVGGIEVDPSDLQVSINPATHVATFTSSLDSTGIFTVVFTAADPGGLSDNDTMLVTVAGGNDLPYVANPISDRTYAEDSGPHTVVTNLDSVFADPDPGTVFSYSAAAGNSNVQVSVQNKALIVNFAANATGNTLITVTANDGGFSVDDQFNITITPVNDPPVVAGIPNVNFPEDGSTTLGLDPFVSDVDNDPAAMTWSAEVIAAQTGTGPQQAPRGKSGENGANGIEVDPSDLQISINPATHVATFTSTADTSGIFTVVFTATDPGGLSDSDTILVTVASGNDLPYVANPISDRTYAEDSGPHTVVTNLDSVFADPDPGTVFSYSAASGSNKVQVSVQNRALIVNFTANATGNALITVTANDGSGFSVDDQFNITITPVNDPPVVAGIPNVTFPEDGSTTLGLDPFVSDVDNDPAAMTWSAEVIAAQAGTQPQQAPRRKSGENGANGIEVDPSDLQISINPATHVATFTSTADTSGIFTVVFTAADPGGLSDSDTILVTVTGSNDQPFVANPISDRTYAEDSGPHTVVTNLDSVFADPDPGTVLSYSAASGSSDVQVSVQNKALIVNFAANAFGNYQITVTANDGSGGSVDDQFDLDITPVNDPPAVAGIPDVSFPEDSSAVLDLDPYVSDIDNDSTAMSWTAEVIAAQTGLAPLERSGEIEMDKGESGRPGANGIEVDPTDLQISINPGNRVATFTSTADTSGIFTVVFTAADPGGLSDSDTMLVTVAGINDLPYVANPISDRTYAEDSGPHTVVTNLDSVFADPDPGTVFSYSASSNNGDVQVSVQNKSLKVNFAANAFGSALITVTANDGSGLSASDQFNLEVTPVNDAPVVAGIPNIVFPQDSSATLDLDPFADDIDNSDAELTWSAAVISAQSVEVDTSDLQISIDPGSHVATFTVTPDSSGKFTVVFTASDPGGLSDSDTMTVTVSAIAQPFVLNPIPNKTYAEDSGPHIAASDLNTVFFNPNPADPLSYSAVSDNPDILVSLTSPTLSVDFSANYFGIGNVIVTATNSSSFSISDTFRVTVISVNDLPVISGLPDTVSFRADSSATLAMWDFVADIETADPQLTFQFTAGNDSLQRSYNSANGELTLSSLGGFSGPVALGIFVTDGDNATVSDTIRVIVEPLLGIDLPLEAGIPVQYELEQNYPNPFNPNTAIRFQLPEAQQVRLTVYSILGQKVRTLISERLAAGYHQAVWDGLNERGAQMSSGVYIYRLEAGKYQQVRKMILLK